MHDCAMKNLAPCPKCGSKQAYVIDPASIFNHDTMSAHPLTLASADWKSVRVEARVCAECAYTELYAKDLDVLARLAWLCLGNVQRVDIP